MSTKPATRRPSARKRWAFRGVAVGLLGLTIFVLGEAGTRILGYAPYDPQVGRFEFQVDPGGTLYVPHARLAYVLKPGSYTIKQSVTWHARHVGAFHRATSAEDTGELDDGREAIWMFGDSNTYGWALDDHQGYPWVLQEMHPELHVINFGVGGYSTLQSFYQLEEALTDKGSKPTTITLAYASYHDGRNELLRANRKTWYFYRERYPHWPRAWLESGELKDEVGPLDYSPWPFSEQSSFINFLEDRYNKVTVLTSGANDVSRALITRFDQRCKEHGIAFHLLGIGHDFRTFAVLDWAKEQGISVLDISVDQSLPENVVPGDGHPSASSHLLFAKRVDQLIQQRHSIAPTEGGARSAGASNEASRD